MENCGGGRRQCRDCHICSVLGVGNGRESITVEPFLQIMTPARKGTGAPMHKHSQPTWENMLVFAEYWRNRFFLQRQNGGGHVRICLLLLIANSHMWLISMKNDAFNRAPHFALPLHLFHNIARLLLEISKRLSRRQTQESEIQINESQKSSCAKTMHFDEPATPVESRTFVYEFRRSKPCVCSPEDEGPSSSRTV